MLSKKCRLSPPALVVRHPGLTSWLGTWCDNHYPVACIQQCTIYLPVCENAVLSDSLAHALRTLKSVDNKFSDRVNNLWSQQHSDSHSSRSSSRGITEIISVWLTALILPFAASNHVVDETSGFWNMLLRIQTETSCFAQHVNLWKRGLTTRYVY